jgi:hypothetical protein
MAMRLGSQHSLKEDPSDRGRFGLGLKDSILFTSQTSHRYHKTFFRRKTFLRRGIWIISPELMSRVWQLLRAPHPTTGDRAHSLDERR